MTIKEWASGGSFCQIEEHSIFYKWFHQSTETTENIVYLHGYPTSCYDLDIASSFFPNDCQLLAHDHLGFGLSDKPKNENYSLKKQAQIALKLWQEMKIEHCYIIAHDYGTSIATEIIALNNEQKCPIQIKGIVLCNGSVHIELSQLRWIQKALKSPIWGKFVSRLSFRKIFHFNMLRICQKHTNLSEQELNLHWAMLVHNKGRQIFHIVTRYIDQRYTNWDRWIGALRASDLPMLILWGMEDPVAVPAIAAALQKDILNHQFVPLNGIGHYPMLESPKEWTEPIVNFIRRTYNNH